ncbi:MAG: hypothetical protein HY655_15525 [Acidobacteria bacterium]|nr:hypothetical protein [Acidobacteriota bacterium]
MQKDGFGIGIEGNPVVATLMTEMGHGLGLLSAKTAAAVLGVCLHLHEIHSVVALLRPEGFTMILQSSIESRQTGRTLRARNAPRCVRVPFH